MKDFPGEVRLIVTGLSQLADRMAMDGDLTGAGMVLAGLQTVRVLWERIQAAPVPAPVPAPAQPPVSGELADTYSDGPRA